MINQINPIIFKTFLCRIKRKKNLALEKLEQSQIEKEIKERNKENIEQLEEQKSIDGFSQQSSVFEQTERKKLIFKLKKKQINYVLSYRD